MDDKINMSLSKYLPLRDVVFNNLRQAILRGELVPGERLMEKQLAERMGVSRTPIREAIRKLELEGLVIMVPRKGAQVADITEKEIQDVLEVRAALEELAVKIACKKMKIDQIEILRENSKKFEMAANDKDIEKLVELDIKFHDLIFKATENKKLLQILNNLSEQVYRYRRAYLNTPTIYPIILKEHKQIIEAIAEHNEELASKRMLDHDSNQEKKVIAMYREEKEGK